MSLFFTPLGSSPRIGRQVVATLAVVLCLLAPAALAAGPSDDPKGPVADLQATMVEVMKAAPGHTVSERYAMLAPAIRDRFHFAVIAKLAVGNYWKDATPDQRARLSDGVFRLTGSTLATYMDGYDDQVFEVRGITDGPAENVMIVNTMLIQPHSDDHRLDYLVAFKDGRWGVIDAIIDGGISELNVRRSEYRKLLEEGGIEALISALNAKADELLQ